MGRKVTGPLDINIRRLIRKLEKTKINIWKAVAESLKKARRVRVEANLGKINRFVRDGDVIVVPGKVLGTGLLEKKITIGALAWSEGAKGKVEASGSKLLDLEQMLESYPNGSNVKIMK
ncbi:MAG: 50S ribosomal protein L18e [Promethearchaeota archaeon]